MKVEVKDGKHQEEIKYPCLKINNNTGLVVLFNREGEGTVIISDNKEPLGYYSTGWCESMFTLYTSSITLSND